MSSHLPLEAEDILTFWAEAGEAKWWKRDEAFDTEIARRFSTIHEQAAQGQLENWCQTPNGALALIIVLDQFSRNLFRNSPKAFAQDAQCLVLVHALMAKGTDRKMRDDLAPFVYLPLMHSEKLSDQDLCIQEMQRLDLEEQVKFAKIHRDIIVKFGRFPHRNEVLGRDTTPQEAEFLANGGFSR